MTQPEVKTDEAVNVQWAGTPCPHLHVIMASRGGWHFSEGEAWDDIETYLFCLDCLQEIEPPHECDGGEDNLPPLG